MFADVIAGLAMVGDTGWISITGMDFDYPAVSREAFRVEASAEFTVSIVATGSPDVIKGVMVSVYEAGKSGDTILVRHYGQFNSLFFPSRALLVDLQSTHHSLPEEENLTYRNEMTLVGFGPEGRQREYPILLKGGRQIFKPDENSAIVREEQWRTVRYWNGPEGYSNSVIERDFSGKDQVRTTSTVISPANPYPAEWGGNHSFGGHERTESSVVSRFNPDGTVEGTISEYTTYSPEGYPVRFLAYPGTIQERYLSGKQETYTRTVTLPFYGDVGFAVENRVARCGAELEIHELNIAGNGPKTNIKVVKKKKKKKKAKGPSVGGRVFTAVTCIAAGTLTASAGFWAAVKIAGRVTAGIASKFAGPAGVAVVAGCIAVAAK